MSIQNVSLVLAFAAGLASFLSPCVLPLVPAYLAYLGGTAGQLVPAGASAGTMAPGPSPRHARAQLLLGGTTFVIGLSLVFILLFYLLRALPAGLRLAAAPVAGVLVILLALQMAGVLRLPFLMGEHRLIDRVPLPGGGLTGFLLGLSFAAGWTPCIGPTLGAVLSSSETQGTTAAGLSLMVAYCGGLGLPFLGMAALFERATPMVRRLNRHQRAISLVASGVLVLMGLLLLTNNLVLLNQAFSRVLPDSLQTPFGI